MQALRPCTHTNHHRQAYFDTHKAIVQTFAAPGYPAPETPMACRNAPTK